ncbi:ABC transporter G family member 20 isoform X2 [Plutella xylostella]|uniref:ABC transporter G family member 20 isoform X1 n=2 Tax=Plutella xylostella TaxID=51655 RepID=UPI002032DCF3|nr:ABC transporter G family member 20 isoform X1 [Plutella xylostella]XP_048486545.1 ABC transporter G family member 20 isoform X2 [Plutella xylostella]
MLSVCFVEKKEPRDHVKITSTPHLRAQTPKMEERRPAAVLVERAYKYYGRLNKPDYKSVLCHLDMTVDRGSIYGLLGASGCGKTTLLSCIVGRRKLDSGDIWVLGGRPGEKGSGVPGPNIGYMPQEIALVGEFTVRDAIFYFGRIYGMKAAKMQERFDFLTSLLELSDGGKLVKHLSGGQQRRVSLAAALVHEPELLILDEPCVGLDPVLRERIWEFLAGLARGGTTVIITTHYIDETKQAHKIGLLRDGQLLAEQSPEQLLRQFSCDTLEDAFLKLALRQHEYAPKRNTLKGSPDVIPETSVSRQESRFPSREDFSGVTSSTDVLTKQEKPKKIKGKTRARYKAVFIKNIQQFGRNPAGLLFAVLFPIVQAVAFFLAVGHDPRDLHVAVVNHEAGFSPWGLAACKNSSLQQITKTENDNCELSMLSCWFVEEMEKHDIYQIAYDSPEAARASVHAGRLYGALVLPHNFSSALAVRVREGDVDDDTVRDSTISVWIDQTNHQISHFMKRKLHKTWETFTARAMRACGRPENMVRIPVNFADPVYGSMDAQFVDFMAPGIMITIIFFMSALVTSTIMISDRSEGVWERSAVAGVRPQEMLNVHIVLQASVIFIQTLELIILGFFGYDLPAKGSLFNAGTLLFLQGISGMCYGFLLSICCTSFTLAFFIVTGSFYPMILLCGILWPVEGMYQGVRALALTLPFTIPIKSLRDIMEKGATMADPIVYQGYLVTLAWISFTLAICYLRLRYQKL